jgi:hypothetical protein
VVVNKKTDIKFTFFHKHPRIASRSLGPEHLYQWSLLVSWQYLKHTFMINLLICLLGDP